jgi:hypothetical protein
MAVLDADVDKLAGRETIDRRRQNNVGFYIAF